MNISFFNMSCFNTFSLIFFIAWCVSFGVSGLARIYERRYFIEHSVLTDFFNLYRWHAFLVISIALLVFWGIEMQLFAQIFAGVKHRFLCR